MHDRDVGKSPRLPLTGRPAIVPERKPEDVIASPLGQGSRSFGLRQAAAMQKRLAPASHARAWQ